MTLLIILIILGLLVAWMGSAMLGPIYTNIGSIGDMTSTSAGYWSNFQIKLLIIKLYSVIYDSNLPIKIIVGYFILELFLNSCGFSFLKIPPKK